MNFIELCKKIISLDSTPSNGNAEVAQFCSTICKEAGLDVTLQEGAYQNLPNFNLIARPPNLKGDLESVVFQTHLDTVEPGPMGSWTKTDSNPFHATIEGDKIFGLGVADVKLDFLCKLAALREFKDHKFKRPFALVGTYAEEVGMVGAQHLIDSKILNFKKAIIGEPSELQIVHANNGYMVVEFKIKFSEEEKRFNVSSHDSSRTQEKIFHGKAVHSSTPHLGDNAILKLVSYIEKLPKGIAVIRASGGVSNNTVPADANIEVDPSKVFKKSIGDELVSLFKELQKLEREFLNYEDKNFSPSYPTMNPGILRTDEEGLTLNVSFRITPNIEKTVIEQWLQKMTAFSQAKGMKFVAQRMSPPALTSIESSLVQGAIDIAKKLNLKEKPITKASGTECSIYSSRGVDCFVFGPGVSVGNSHTANEYNFISQLEKAKEFYTEAVKRFCL